MTDRILAILAIISVVAYFLPLILKVPEPGLIIVLCIVIVMAVYDFIREFRSQP
jgi:hypothetical protein